MTAEAIFFAALLAAVVLLWIGITLALRAVGIDDDWDPT